jgi:hypothetical protein
MSSKEVSALFPGTVAIALLSILSEMDGFEAAIQQRLDQTVAGITVETPY